jgi:hypothetical protein
MPGKEHPGCSSMDTQHNQRQTQMTDIVKVLRGKYALDYDEKTLDQFCNEAADEIEKLKAALRDIARQPEGDEESAQAVARAVLGEKQ